MIDNVSSFENLSIYNNPSLYHCDTESICNYLANPTGAVNIYNNADGCNNPPEVADACGIALPCLPYGNYYFFTQNEIDNITSYYPSCDTLEGDVVIGYYTGSDITNLNGFSAVMSIGGTLKINSTDSLASLTGLDNIKASSIDQLHIKYNTSLSTCEIQSICDYLADPNGEIQIWGNATGCNSPEEVQDSCEAHVGIFDGLSLAIGLLIYPNPSSTSITIELPTHPLKNTFLTISNINDQQLITQAVTEPQTEIDISYLPAGIYIAKVWSDKDVMVQKVIKR